MFGKECKKKLDLIHTIFERGERRLIFFQIWMYISLEQGLKLLCDITRFLGSSFQSQSHRMVEVDWSSGEYLVPLLLRLTQLEQVLHDYVWPDFEYLQGRGFYILLDQLVVFDHFKAKKVFPMFKWSFSSLLCLVRSPLTLVKAEQVLLFQPLLAFMYCSPLCILVAFCSSLLQYVPVFLILGCSKLDPLLPVQSHKCWEERTKIIPSAVYSLVYLDL